MLLIFWNIGNWIIYWIVRIMGCENKGLLECWNIEILECVNTGILGI